MVATGLSFDTYHNIIDGKQRGAEKTRHGINPATKEPLWEVPCGTQQDLDDAVEAAQRAFESYSKTTLEERHELLAKAVDLVEQYKSEFAKLLGQENGKPRVFALHECETAKDIFRHHSTLKIPSEKYEDDEKSVTTRYVPLGIVGAICPWNFPLTLSAGKIAPALLAGCAIIVKPSPFTPYGGLKLVELLQQIYPPGLVQAVGGGDDIGPMYVDHPGISKISFTGSIATGKRIMAGCAKTLKRVTLELGGNDPTIVFPDVDMDKVVPELVLGSFFNSGQMCVAIKRVYIHDSIYREFVDRMAAYTKTLKVGHADEEGVMFGPVQNEMQYNRVKEYFADSKKNGHKFVAGGPDVKDSKGFFVTPSIVDNPPNDSRLIQEEPFGPILPVQPWSDLEEVIHRANNTNTGLGASVWTKDVAKGEEVAQRLQAGNVFVNSWVKPIPQAFFSGHKESGIGGEWGSSGVLAYCNAQATHVYKQK